MNPSVEVYYPQRSIITYQISISLTNIGKVFNMSNHKLMNMCTNTSRNKTKSLIFLKLQAPVVETTKTLHVTN